MKLVDLNPKWVSHAAGRAGTGLRFDCPCSVCDATPEGRFKIVVPFSNPLDSGPTCATDGKGWTRHGATFDTISLEPSIDVSAQGHFHGFVRHGRVCW